MSKNVVEPQRPQTTWQTHGAYWIRLHMRKHMPTSMHTRARARTHTQKYVILNAFPRQQWFNEHASMLHYTYIACLVELWP